MADAGFDLATAPACCFDAFCAGVIHGALTRAQLEDERRDAEDAELHHRAYELVQVAARQPSHDELVEQRRRRTIESAQRWATEGEALSG